MTLACVEVRDNKPKRSRDPGQTGKLHRGFRAAADMQLRGLRAALRQAVVDVNVLGLSGPSDFTFMAPETRLNQFAGWLETAANASLDARWWAHPWLHRAIQHGLTMAQAELGGKAYMASPASFETLHQLAHHELRGIIAALVQQVVRQAHRVTARRLVPHKAFRDLAKPIDKAIHNRLHAFVQVMTVKAHIHGKVAYYRQAGLTHVGINPELKNPKRIVKQRDRAMRDRDIESVAEAIWQTAEDEDVCDECEEMAAGSPYSIDEIEDLIPLHVNCRCDAVIWDDSDVNDSMTVDAGNPDVDFTKGEGGRFTGSVGHTHSSIEFDPELVNVGGDEWNRNTALRLEQDYQKVRPTLESLATTLVDKPVNQPVDEENFAPEEWEQLSNDIQEQVESKYKENHLQQEIDYQIESWHDNGDALDDAKQQLIGDYNNKAELPDWFIKALDSAREQREEDGQSHIPYTDVQLRNAIDVSSEPGWEGKKDAIEFDDTKLEEPDNLPLKEQLTFPGIEPETRSDHLTPEMRRQLEITIKTAFKAQAHELESDLDAPDYLSDSAAESLEEYWKSMDDSDKFNYAKQFDLVPEPEQPEPDIAEVEIPAKFDPLETIGGRDYRQTGILGRAMSIERTAQLLVERGLTDSHDKAITAAQYIDASIWGHWKSSSKSANGVLMQYAISQEFNTHYRQTGTSHESVESLQTIAKQYLGGMAGVKAYVRAKWETSQYLLDKSGDKVVDLYRSISLGYDADLGREEKVGIFPEPGSTNYIKLYTRLPELAVKRNGAASTTTAEDIANGWDGGDRVVLRFEVPRTSLFGLPCYGQNVYNEHEVVMLGGVIKNWDAWRTRAPTIREVPFGAPAIPEEAKPAEAQHA